MMQASEDAAACEARRYAFADTANRSCTDMQSGLTLCIIAPANKNASRSRPFPCSGNVMFDEAAFDKLLCTALRQEAAAWPQAWHRPDDPETALTRIEFHGIAGLLLTSPQWLVRWPSRLMAGLHEQARSHALWEMAHQHVLTILLRDLHREGIDALVMKGTALAYSLYDDPAMRPRGDTDLLIRKGDLPRARELLENLGFARPYDLDAVFGVHHLEEIWQFSFRDQSWHDIDLHWSVIAVPALSDILQVDACLAASRPLPRLCCGPACKRDPVSGVIGV